MGAGRRRTMELRCGLFICLLLCGVAQLCSPQMRLWVPQAETPPPLLSASASPVEVECLEAQLVVTVSRDLFGTGKLIHSSDVRLGPAGCEPLRSAGTADVIRFEASLHGCGNRVQVRLGPLALLGVTAGGWRCTAWLQSWRTLTS